MEWKEIVTALVTVLTALGGWEAIKYLINRKSNGRKAKAEAKTAESDADKGDANAYIETAAAQFVLLKDVTEFLQSQLKEKEERFKEQTDHVRELNRQLLESQNETAKAKIEAMEMRCEVQKCPNRKPPTGY
ncbi:MAG: hypothetical protein LUC24_02175 [Bacteroidales bacterium]|nr:hypothetical protein [Bacteroidales bacterium]